MPPTDRLEQIQAFLHLTTHHRGEAAGAYDDAAPAYDLFASVWDHTVAAPALRRFERILHAGIADGADVLEVGAGTGERTVRMLAASNPSRVVAFDASEGMLDQAKPKIDDPRVEFVVGDAMHLPFPDDSFDVVYSAWLLSILDDPRGAVSEFLRVLKPGGLIVYAFCSLPQGPLGQVVDWIATHVAPEYNPLSHTLARDEQPLCGCDRATVARFAAGFTSVVSLGKCCPVQDTSLPCALEIGPDAATQP